MGMFPAVRVDLLDLGMIDGEVNLARHVAPGQAPADQLAAGCASTSPRIRSSVVRMPSRFVLPRAQPARAQ
jgi:hypothetical protein